MKKIFPSFFIVICILLNACSKDNNIPNNPNNISNGGGDDYQTFMSYGIDTTNLRAKYYFHKVGSDTIEFAGIKNGYLWLAEYNTKSKQQLDGWKDVQKTENPLKAYSGYGKYDTINIESVYPSFYKKTGKGYIVDMKFNIGSKFISQCIFIVNGISTYRTALDINKFYNLYDWYGEYVRMMCNRYPDYEYSPTQIIYDENGDSIFSLRTNISVENLVTVSQYINNSISNDSVINVNRYDLLNNKTIWSKYIPLGFLISQDTKVSYTTQKQDNTWTYNYVFLFYDGTKKNFSFSVDVNTGVYKIGGTS
jgi:hypothetical protein